MFTFSLLVSIAQDKDLELSYCVPSVRMIGSSRIVVISQDMTFTSGGNLQKVLQNVYDDLNNILKYIHKILQNVIYFPKSFLMYYLLITLRGTLKNNYTSRDIGWLVSWLAS